MTPSRDAPLRDASATRFSSSMICSVRSATAAPDWMSAVGVRVHPRNWRLIDHSCDRVAHTDAAEREVAGCDRLGKLHDVRRDTPVLEREPLPGSPEPGDHFVGGEEHLVLVADFADAWEVVVGRDDDTADADHRLGEKHRHGVGAFSKDRFFELVGHRTPYDVPPARAARYGYGAGMWMKPGTRGSKSGQ